MIRKVKYKDQHHQGRPGVRWAFMEKFQIRRVPGDPYLTRWRIVHTPWFGILLHKIDGPDPDDHPHDHPWNFLTIILKGGYTEQFIRRGVEGPLAYRTTTLNKWHRGSIHKMRQGTYHKILRLHGKPTWTLVLTGPRKSEWGFLTENGHVNWKEYLGVPGL